VESRWESEEEVSKEGSDSGVERKPPFVLRLRDQHQKPWRKEGASNTLLKSSQTVTWIFCSFVEGQTLFTFSRSGLWADCFVFVGASL
jgi:hypothetical protein